jgi:phosphotransferase system enzyme I (PtsI)
MAKERTLTGTSIGGGYALARAFLYVPFLSHLPSRNVTADEIPLEFALLDKGLKQASEELEAIFKRASGPKKDIIEAQKLMLLDEDMIQEIKDAINSGDNAAKAIRDTYESYIALFEKNTDDLFKARALDLRDLENRLLRGLEGCQAPSLDSFHEDIILVAHDLTPSEMATLDRLHVKGLIGEIGGETSHTAILARSYGLPTVLGVTDALKFIKPSQKVAIDAQKGIVQLGVDEETEKEYQAKEEVYIKEKARQDHYLPLPGLSEDGKKIDILLNLADVEKTSLEKAEYVDGVGLLRSEFLYMKNDHLPNEEEQFVAYRKVLLSFPKKMVVIRTLDIGGDKKLSYLPLPHEDNPQLGERALRLCLANPQIFKPQLRALLRASIYGNLGIMFPMVESFEDIKKAWDVVAECKHELDKEGLSYDRSVKLGVMIEVPSLALIAEKVAPIVDFASIGTNDLTQYTLGVDRGNPSLKLYYQKYHPAVLRLIAHAEEAFRKEGKPISVCGELGGDSLGAPFLVGLGFTRLSMSFSKVASIKAVLAENKQSDLAEMSQYVLNLGSEKEVRDYISAHLKGAA